MGIADDIKPSRRIHFEPVKDKKEELKAAPEVEEVIIHQDEEPSAAEKTDLKNSFFALPKKVVEEKVEEKKELVANTPVSRGNLVRNIFATLTLVIFLIFMGIMVLQNQSTIKLLFSNSDKSTDTKKPTTENKSEAETEAITPTDYTNQNSAIPTGTQTTPTNQTAQQPSNTITPVTTPTAPATTTTTINKSAILLEVLNGNGVVGSADKAKVMLTNAGFTVSRVANASKFSYEQSYIYYKSTKAKEAEAVKAALTGYEITLESSDQIAKNYDVVVVIGKK